MNNIMSWIGVVISALSLLVAIVAIVKSARAQKDANSVQRRLVEIEEQCDQQRQYEALQAKLRPELMQNGQDSWLYLVNFGAAEARHIRVEMDEKPLVEHPAAIPNSLMPDLVGPGSKISCQLLLDEACQPPFKIKITWDDTSGEDRTFYSTLTR